jgi:hypothetical protein
MLLCGASVSAQNARVSLSRHAGRIPKSCESVVAASVADPIDIPALVKEAYCKGAGDTLAEYTYVMNSVGRSVDKKRRTKEESTTYEVFIPTLKGGTRGNGVMVVTQRNGVPVPEGELEKARLDAGKRLEKAEARNASEKPLPPETAPEVKGMLPLGMYTSTTNKHSSTFGKSTSTTFAIHTFLKTCELTFARREQHEGREILIFNFTPRANAELSESEKYIAQLKGEIWIDAQDRIVTRLSGRPTLGAGTVNPTPTAPAPAEAPPAVYMEMQRLPDGVWLPRVIRINGVDYNKLFDGMTWDSSWTFSNFRRFSTEVQDVKVNPDGKP